jgi:anti-anti-sigma factor
MAIVCDRLDGACRLRIEQDLTIYTAAGDREALAPHLADCAGLEVDLSRVAEIDTAGCQLLLALEQEAARQGKPLRFTGHSRAVLDLLDTYNLAAYFGDPLVLPGQS